MAAPREIPGLGPEVPFSEAAARALEVRTDELFERRRGVLDPSDSARVRDMGVASRRLRTVLETFRPCFPRKELKRALREVEAVGDALGERRDADLALHRLERAGAGLTLDEQPGVESLAGELRLRQRVATEELRGALELIEERQLRPRLHALAAGARRR